MKTSKRPTLKEYLKMRELSKLGETRIRKTNSSVPLTYEAQLFLEKISLI